MAGFSEKGELLSFAMHEIGNVVECVGKARSVL